ncbi:NmrA family NAD(P)-binding protein [Rhizobium sp. LC145]|uniref:NmrA family NAD(P)-binding protein n=1 Tax=Rhizobium sp. LC145 TaxID=1120688 RepID=UPI000629FEF7|nr:NmrA family NAD(P)-binding protein [Rhizobium sp. LC145]KKX30520.1 epimerase [Rhizobium sp. LC145]TKT46510.1 NAD-dependent epimerase/dehydratase family protein [Rhizobiaceae bacterium LC148]
MQLSSPTILVIGATGKFASLVVPALARRGASVRAFVRDGSRGEIAIRMGAIEFAIGDLRDADSLARAMTGVDGVFHIGPAFAVDEAAMGVAAVEAAERAGVRKFVFSSVIQPTNARLENHASKIPVEEALYSSRLEYTILHPANLMQNIGLAWPAILKSGCFAEPFPGKAKIARVDYRDVAEVAAIALTGEKLAYATLELSAGMYSRDEIASVMTKELGRPIKAAAPSFEEWVAAAQLPYDERGMRLLARVFEHYGKYGLGGNSLSLAAALGRPPRSLPEYIQGLAQGEGNTSAEERNHG